MLAMRLTTRIGFCCVLLALVIAGTIPVYSQVCYFTSTKVNPPEGTSVPAGQPVNIAITLAGGCTAPGTYTIRADIVGSKTFTSRTQLVVPDNQFATSLVISAVAPAATGWWSFQVNVYILANGETTIAGPPSQQVYGLNVVPYTPTSTTVTTQSTVQSSSFTGSSSESTIGPTTAGQSQSASFQPAYEASPFGNGMVPILLGILMGVLVSVPIVVFRFRRRTR